LESGCCHWKAHFSIKHTQQPAEDGLVSDALKARVKVHGTKFTAAEVHIEYTPANRQRIAAQVLTKHTQQEAHSYSKTSTESVTSF
jgi:hypothetical protein